MSFSRYERYKDSGVEWLGEVPEHWKVKRLAHFFFERREKVSDKDFEPLSVTKNGVVPQLDTAAKTDDGDNRKKVCNGDFVINGRSDRKGSSGVAGQNGSVSLINVVLQPYGINSSFTHHLLRCQPFQEEFYRYGKGIVADLWSTNFSEMRNIILAVPSSEEQSTIATFLDQETSKIDALVAEQQRLIELLKEKRQAVISHAVTKGLNPNVPMKDSGVEWLGEVPEHWGVKRLRFIAQLNPSKKETTELDRETEVSFLPMEAISDDGSLNLERTRPIGEVETGYTYFREGDVTIAKITPCFENGKGAVMRGLFGGIGFGTTELIVARAKPFEATSNYLHWLFISAWFRKYGEASMYGAGGQKRVSDDFVRDFAIAIPAISEQQIITTFLDHETAKLDTLTTEAQRAITLLQERRTAVISATVTGKIDVREIT